MDSLTTEERARYKRTMALPDMGEKGQCALKRARVLVIGAGGLGSPALWYLASVGVGTIGIVDHDVVDISNLQRQTLHATSDIGIKKVMSSREKLCALNPNITIIPYDMRFDAASAKEIFADGYDFVLDCVDNFETKLAINEICVRHTMPFSHAGILEYQGQTMTVLPHTTACYRCAFPTIPATLPLQSTQRGVLGAVPGVIGAIQATEAMKFIIGWKKETLLTNTLLTYDARVMQFRRVVIQKRENCVLCGIS